MAKYPARYTMIMKRYKGVVKAVDGLGRATKAAGPLNRKVAELIQLAAAAAVRLGGIGPLPCRRAFEAGRKAGRVRHAVILLASTIGFPACLGRAFVGG